MSFRLLPQVVVITQLIQIQEIQIENRVRRVTKIIPKKNYLYLFIINIPLQTNVKSYKITKITQLNLHYNVYRYYGQSYYYLQESPIRCIYRNIYEALWNRLWSPFFHKVSPPTTI